MISTFLLVLNILAFMFICFIWSSKTLTNVLFKLIFFGLGIFNVIALIKHL